MMMMVMIYCEMAVNELKSLRSQLESGFFFLGDFVLRRSWHV